MDPGWYMTTPRDQISALMPYGRLSQTKAPDIQTADLAITNPPAPLGAPRLRGIVVFACELVILSTVIWLSVYWSTGNLAICLLVYRAWASPVTLTWACVLSPGIPGIGISWDLWDSQAASQRQGGGGRGRQPLGSAAPRRGSEAC